MACFASRLTAIAAASEADDGFLKIAIIPLKFRISFCIYWDPMIQADFALVPKVYSLKIGRTAREAAMTRDSNEMMWEHFFGSYEPEFPEHQRRLKSKKGKKQDGDTEDLAASEEISGNQNAQPADL